jgi:hypothetical protein
MTTCGTYEKAHFLNAPAKLDLFRDLFFASSNRESGVKPPHSK